MDDIPHLNNHGMAWHGMGKTFHGSIKIST